MKRKLVYIGFAFEHHLGTQAGYHHIREHVRYDYIIDCQKEYSFVEGKHSSLLVKICRKIYCTILGRKVPFALLKCIWLSLFQRNLVFHFIYGENTYKWLHYFKRNNKIVCTFHQPADYFRENTYWQNVFPKLDAIILMSKGDIQEFRKWSDKTKVVFIPHGINTDFYKPDDTIRRENRVLMVGSWLRDFQFANAVFLKLRNMNPDILITVVSSAENKKYFENLSEIEFLSGISDNELRKMYCRSKCLFLPLVSYTANNAMLEGASVGCNIVVATNHVDDSYFDNNQINVYPLDIDNFADILYRMETTRNSEIRQYVLANFSWFKIGRDTQLLMTSLE